MKKYILVSAIIMVLLPLPFMVIPILGSMISYLYITPLGLIGGMLGSTQMFLYNAVFYVFPNSTGWPIVIATWFVIGSLIGALIYSFREIIYLRKKLPVPNFGFLSFLLTILLQVLIAYGFLYAIQPFSKKEKDAAEMQKQKYYAENCKTIYTQKHHYKIIDCPNGNGTAEPAALIEYMSETGQINHN